MIFYIHSPWWSFESKQMRTVLIGCEHLTIQRTVDVSVRFRSKRGEREVDVCHDLNFREISVGANRKRL